MKRSAKPGAAVLVMAGALCVAAVGLSGCVAKSGPATSATGAATDLAIAAMQEAGRREERAARQRAERVRQTSRTDSDYVIENCFAPAQQKAEAVTQTETVFAPTHRAEFGTNGGGGC